MFLRRSLVTCYSVNVLHSVLIVLLDHSFAFIYTTFLTKTKTNGQNKDVLRL